MTIYAMLDVVNKLAVARLVITKPGLFGYGFAILAFLEYTVCFSKALTDYILCTVHTFCQILQNHDLRFSFIAYVVKLMIVIQFTGLGKSRFRFRCICERLSSTGNVEFLSCLVRIFVILDSLYRNRRKGSIFRIIWVHLDEVLLKHYILTCNDVHISITRQGQTMHFDIHTYIYIQQMTKLFSVHRQSDLHRLIFESKCVVPFSGAHKIVHLQIFLFVALM